MAKKTAKKKASGESRARVPEWAKGLTVLQRRFVEEYTKDCNATRAAKAAGYSEKTAHSISWENLRKPEISAAIKIRLDELSLSADEILHRVTILARGSLYPFMKFGEDGEWGLDITTPDAIAALPTLKTITVDRKIGRTEAEFDDGGRMTVRSIEDERIKVELHDQMRALELLGRAHGLWEKPEAKGEDGFDALKRRLVERMMALPEAEFQEMYPFIQKLSALLGEEGKE